jgi:Flp pilus assembly protein TadB
MTIKNKHLLIILICCALVMLAIIILPKYFNLGSFVFLLILLCPLSHIILMKLFMKKNKKTDTKNNNCH